jgi:hypothetical protein
MANKACKEASLVDKIGLFFSNYKKLHQAAVTHCDEGVGHSAIGIIAGSKMLSEWDKNHYFGDTAIFAPSLSVAENAWGRIEGGVIPESDKLDKAKLVASFSSHEPVAIDALDYVEKSEIDERDKLKNADYIGVHTKYLSVAKRTLNLIVRSKLRNEEKIPYMQEIAGHSKHGSIKKKANDWLESYRIIKA